MLLKKKIHLSHRLVSIFFMIKVLRKLCNCESLETKQGNSTCFQNNDKLGFNY